MWRNSELDINLLHCRDTRLIERYYNLNFLFIRYILIFRHLFYIFTNLFVILGGKPLVHSLQVQYIHQLIQSRLVENPQPLTEVYNCLHFFCQSLQLEVLYSQTLRLMRDRLDDHIHVDEYIPGKGLTVSYWR